MGGMGAGMGVGVGLGWVVGRALCHCPAVREEPLGRVRLWWWWGVVFFAGGGAAAVGGGGAEEEDDTDEDRGAGGMVNEWGGAGRVAEWVDAVGGWVRSCVRVGGVGGFLRGRGRRGRRQRRQRRHGVNGGGWLRRREGGQRGWLGRGVGGWGGLGTCVHVCVGVGGWGVFCVGAAAAGAEDNDDQGAGGMV